MYAKELHPNIAAIYNSFEFAFSCLRDYQAALKFDSRSYKANKTVFGKQHLDRATAYNNLGLRHYKYRIAP